MRAHKLAWRALRAAAQQQWQQSRRDFFAMAITSAAFRAAKGAYARMTLEAETEKLNWRGALHKAQAARTAHASARAVLRVARREQEKLACLADELKSALRMSE
jgi:GH24 family phage-related lysozyme (muramidase)